MDINEVSYRKDYYEKHKDRIKQQVKSRYLTKKDEINKKIKCEKCGRLIIERMLKKHLNTNICNGIKKEKKEKPKKEKPVKLNAIYEPKFKIKEGKFNITFD
jgi:hypothetical protein